MFVGLLILGESFFYVTPLDVTSTGILHCLIEQIEFK